MKSIAVCVIAFLFLAACASPSTPTTSLPSGATSGASGNVAQPTTAVQPTIAPQSTATLVPAKPTDTPKPVPTDTPKPQPSPTSGIAKVGQRVESSGIALTVNKVGKTAQIGQFQKAKAGNTYLIAEVLIENINVDKAPYNPFYFKVKDSDGFEYTAAINVSDDSLKSGDLTKGDKARGTVVFEVKESSKGLVLSYSPLVIVGSFTIRVDLGQ